MTGDQGIEMEWGRHGLFVVSISLIWEMVVSSSLALLYFPPVHGRLRVSYLSINSLAT